MKHVVTVVVAVTEVVQEPSGDSEETIDVNLEEVSEVYTLLQRCQQHSEGEESGCSCSHYIM